MFTLYFKHKQLTAALYGLTKQHLKTTHQRGHHVLSQH